MELKINIEKQPGWLQLPEKSHYWTTYGTIRKPSLWEKLTRKVPNRKEMVRVLFYSKEEAEAQVTEGSPFWVWNGEPAQEVLVRDAMYEARKKGYGSVSIKKFNPQTKKWEICFTYYSNEPLPEDL